MRGRTLTISTSPHIVKGVGAETIMMHVVLALIPVVVFAFFAFGINALLVLITTTGSCVAAEHILCRTAQKESTISDWSAVITGILLGLTLPPTFPLWMAFIGGVISISLGKFVFGGLGYNVFNPALVGRAFLQAAFPVAITTWYAPFQDDRFTAVSSSILTLPFMTPQIDGYTGATPLAALKFEQIETPVSELSMGLISGSIGETCSILIIAGGMYLVYRNMMNWRIPVSILASVFVLSGILYAVDNHGFPNPLFMLFSGGLILGAVFMATDMVGSPLTSRGVVIYGCLIGLLVVVIRIWGGLPEGVMYAILLGNAVAPHIDQFVQTPVYGSRKTSISNE